MKPLIVAATKEEISLSIPILEKLEIPYLITGVGMTATAFALGKYLQTNKCDLIINIGIAGSIDKNIPLGQVVQINTDTFSELGTEDDNDFIPIEQLGFGKSTYHSITSKDRNCNLPTYSGITVNKVHGNEESINRIRQIFPQVSIESMEGAAVLYACNQENLPSIQVRAISNYVEKRDRSRWNIPLAIKNVNIWLQEFLEKYY